MEYERDYLELINSLDEPYFQVSAVGEILLCNRIFEQLVGNVTGKLIYDLFAPSDKQVINELISHPLSQKKPQKVLLELQPSSGTPLCVNVSFSSMHKVDSQGKHIVSCRLFFIHKQNDVHRGLIEAQHSLRKKAQELAILNHLAVAISSSLDLDEILNSICREMVKVFDARNTGIALLNDTQTMLKVVAFHTEHPDESNVTGLEIPLEGNDSSLFVITTGEPIVVPDAQFNPITNSLHEVNVQRGTSCLLIVPLLTRGDVIGTIGIPSDSQTIFSREDVQLAMTIAGQIASVIDNARLHRRVQKARDVAKLELEIGRQMQIGFFPESLPQIEGWELFAYFQSAREVAGDFYDAFPLNQNTKLAVVLADVCDKGLAAALFMVLFRSLLRANIQQCFAGEGDSGTSHGERIIEAVRKTNNYIAVNHAQASMFATVFIAILQKNRNLVWYVNCGHDPPFVSRSNGHSDRLMPTNPAIGAFPDLNFASKCIPFEPGDSLIAFTDGVCDARSVDGKSFGEKRLLKILNKSTSLSQRLNYLTNEIVRHTQSAEQYDDITCIAFNRKT